MALPYGEWSGSKLSLAEQSQSGWNWIVLKVPCNPTHSVIIQGDLWPCANGQPVPMGNISQLYGKETQPQPATHAAHQIIKKKSVERARNCKLEGNKSFNKTFSTQPHACTVCTANQLLHAPAESIPFANPYSMLPTVSSGKEAALPVVRDWLAWKLQAEGTEREENTSFAAKG